jgi:hypothetical protein
MEVSNVHEESYDFRMMGIECFICNCSEKVFRVLTFKGEFSKLIQVFGMRNIPKKDGYCKVGFCIEHRNYLHLLGYMMAYHERISQQMISDLNNAYPNQIFDGIMIYRRLNFIKEAGKLSADGVSMSDICRYVSKILVSYVCSDDIQYKLDSSACCSIINKRFADQHPKETLELFMQIKQQSSKLPDKTVYLRYGYGNYSIIKAFLDTIFQSTILFLIVDASRQ